MEASSGIGSPRYAPCDLSCAQKTGFGAHTGPDAEDGGGAPLQGTPLRDALLQVEDLCVSFRMYDEGSKSFFSARQQDVIVLRNLSISVLCGEIVAVVGESGSGKSVLADSVMGAFEPNSTVEGRIFFEGVQLDSEGIKGLRGHGVSYVPQSVSSLDPLMKVGRFVYEGVPSSRAGRRQWRRVRRRRQRELFSRYGLPEEVSHMYPHQLSGGMARRVLLCAALIEDPKLLIADEPTSGLDRKLSTAALGDFRRFADNGGGVLLITHDIELALQVADRVAVFKDGSIVEVAPVKDFSSPDSLKTRYARALWHALPEHDFECAPFAGTSGHGVFLKDAL